MTVLADDETPADTAGSEPEIPSAPEEPTEQRSEPIEVAPDETLANWIGLSQDEAERQRRKNDG